MTLSRASRFCCFFLFLFTSSLFVFEAPPIYAAASNWSQQSSSWGASETYPSHKTPFGRESQAPIAPFTPGSNNLALDVGQVFLMGDMGDPTAHYADSIGTQVHYSYGVSDMFGFDASFGYSDHSDGKYSLTTLLTGLRTNLSWYDKVVPYVVFGLGFYKPNRQISTGVSLSPVVFGIHVGPGVDLELTRQFFFGAALTFHDMFGTTKQAPQGTPVEFDGTFTSFLLHAGVTF